jgi:hypothetical protein
MFTSSRPCFCAVVHGVDAIRFGATARSRDELTSRLADYVAERLDDQLWAGDAACVRALLADGQREAAIAAYFAAVGQRWDEEWLVTTVVDARAGAARGREPRRPGRGPRPMDGPLSR